jgi:hypothetical protein
VGLLAGFLGVGLMLLSGSIPISIYAAVLCTLAAGGFAVTFAGGAAARPQRPTLAAATTQ